MTPNLGFRGALAAVTALVASVTTAQALPNYYLTSLISVPPTAVNNQGGKLASFDITTFDPVTGFLYIGDRSNAGIDVFNLNNNTYSGTIPGFVGFQGSNAKSGADGTLVATLPGGKRAVYGGDGDSTVKGFLIPPNPGKVNSGYTPLFTTSTVLPGGTAATSLRADEMTYNPVQNQILVANNAATPYPYTTILNASTGAIIAQTVFDGTNGNPIAGNGIEASAYDAKSGNYYVAMPQFTNDANNAGGIIVIDPTGKLVASYDFTGLPGISGCTPAGLDISAGGKIAVGCSAPGTQTVIFDPATGKITATPKISGTDAVYYDAASNTFLVAGANDTLNGGKPDFGIVDANTGVLLQVLPTTLGNDHTIGGGAAPGGPDQIAVVFGANAGNTICPNGCVGIFSVPEPSTLPVLAFGLVALMGFAVHRRLN